jgi:uncharacterized protein (TIRG00374 family)
MHRLQILLFALGIGLFAYVVHQVGVGEILWGLSRMGWSFLGIFAIEILIDALHSEGWRWCLPSAARDVSWIHIFLARTAGVAVNILTPTASVGGEVVKGMLIRRWVPIADGFASVMIDKLTFAVAQAIFLCCGVVAVFDGIELSPRERQFALVAIAVWLAAVGAFFLLQRFGIFRVGVGALRTLFGASAVVDKLPGQVHAFDEKVGTYLAEHQRDFAVSVFFHLFAQAFRTAQFYLALSALGFHPDAATCFTTAAGFVFVEATMFLVPARLGVFEGGNILIFTRLGYGAAAGLIVSFTIRLSELASALLGLLALGYYQFGSKGSLESEEKSEPR